MCIYAIYIGDSGIPYTSKDVGSASERRKLHRGSRIGQMGGLLPSIPPENHAGLGLPAFLEP